MGVTTRPRTSRGGFFSFSTLLLSSFASLTTARSYQKGDQIPVTCLNRTIESGEHITDSAGNLQYIPFPTCTETSQPLKLTYLSSQPINCTISLDDSLFHLLEFYVHNDAPLSCRVPSHYHAPGTKDAGEVSGEDKVGALGAVSTSYTPLVMALSGTLQLSHLHVANVLNVLLHTSEAGANGNKKGKSSSPQHLDPNTITTASAYSVSPNTLNERLVIGSDLTLILRPQWYTGNDLEKPTKATHANTWTLLTYMALSAIVSATICIVYFRGIDLPRRLRFHGLDRLGGQRVELPKYNGYGYGVNGHAGNGAAENGRAVGNGYGFTMGSSTTTTGKRD